jgi:chloramphenicol O-acetyltransferase type B
MTPPDRVIPSAMVLPRRLVRTLRVAKLRLSASPAEVRIGRDVAIGPHAFVASPNRFVVGDRVRIGRNFHCETDLEVGQDVLISSNVAFIGRDHKSDDPDQTVFTQGREVPQSIVIEGDSLIGFGTIILGAVTIGRGAIVGAGSLVTRDVPAGMVVVGRPARPIKPRHSVEPSTEEQVDGAQ